MPVKLKRLHATNKKKTPKKPTSPHEPLGWFKAKILKYIALLGPDAASGYAVLEQLLHERGEWVDPGSLYGSIREMAAEGLLEHVGWQPSNDRGPPRKLFKVRPEGTAALKRTEVFYRTIADFLAVPEEKADKVLIARETARG